METKAKSGRYKVSIYRLQTGPGQYTEGWYYRPMRNGQRHFFPLGQFLQNYDIKMPNGEKMRMMGARSRADEIYAYLRSPGASIKEAIKIFDPEYSAKTGSSKMATVRDAIEIYLQVGKRLGIAADTQKKNCRCLYNVIERANAWDEGRPIQSQRGKRNVDDSEYLAVHLERLTAKTVTSFQDSFLSGVDEGDVASEKRARRSANSTLTQARSIFAEQYMDEYRSHGIEIPADWSFLKAKKLKGAALYFMLPPVSVIQAIINNASSLKEEDPNAYRAFLLAIHCSTRKSEAIHCKWDWFDKSDEDYVLRVATDGAFDPKHGHGREVVVPSFVYKELNEIRSRGDYIIEGAEEGIERNDHVWRRLSKWLREQGVDAQKPYHELRKLWFSSKVKIDGLLAAKQQGGHNDMNVTADHYADSKMPESLLSFWRPPEGASIKL